MQLLSYSHTHTHKSHIPTVGPKGAWANHESRASRDSRWFWACLSACALGSGLWQGGLLLPTDSINTALRYSHEH